MGGTEKSERRASAFTEQQLEELADRVAERLAARTFETIGRSVVKRFLWAVGLLAAGALAWAQQKGWLT